MSREIVNEFRSIVDGVIGRKVEQAKNRSWLGMREEASINGLYFVSVQKNAGRLSIFGLGSDYTWGVGTKINPEARWTSPYHFAITSELHLPDTLVRRRSFASAMKAFSVDTYKIMYDSEELELALDWVKSPYLTDFGKLAILEPWESESVEEQQRGLSKSQASLEADLAKLAQARRRPIPHDIIIN